MILLQAVSMVVGIGFALGGALAWLLVMWPAIRRQNRTMDRIDAFLDGPEVKEFQEAFRMFIDSQKKKLLEKL